MDKLTFSTVEEAKEKLRSLALKEFNDFLDESGFSIKDLEKLSAKELEKKRDELSDLIHKPHVNLVSKEYIEGEDYVVLQDPQFRLNTVVGFTFSLYKQFQARMLFINEKIAEHTQENLIYSLKHIVDNELPDKDLKKKIELSLEEFLLKTKELESKIIENANSQKLQPSDIEIKKSELELLDKKTEIFLKFIAKESIASMLGAILLILITIFLIINMIFSDKEPTKIVETAFLLILGYFFGQSTTKSNK